MAEFKYVAAASAPPPSGPQASYWTTYLASDDVDDTAAKIRDAGGTVFADPFDVFDAGRMTVAQDPTGAAFGVWQAGSHRGAQLANEPGTLNWNECQTNDPVAAATFYEQVFGCRVKEFPGGEARPPYRVIQVDGPMDLPEIGRLAVIKDPAGAVFQVLQPPPES